MTWVRVHSGAKVNPFDLDNSPVTLEDIAHSLSMKCRWGGHCSRFYSVARHSLEVVSILRDAGHNPGVLMAGLLHDAHEAYGPDFQSPTKGVWRVLASGAPCVDLGIGVGAVPTVSVSSLHNAQDDAIRSSLRVGYSAGWWHDMVRRADLVALSTEARDLMNDDCSEWPVSMPPPLASVTPHDAPLAAKQEFIDTFNALKARL